MGFYIEELPTELNGITMKEAVYWADIYLQDNPCDRIWDAIRALRDFYETVTSEAVEVADRKTEPQIDDFFREPTAEERKAVAEYIESISIPTGVNVFDLMDEPQTGRSSDEQ